MSVTGARASRPLFAAMKEGANGTPALRETIEATRRDIARRFRQAGIDTPDLDARILAGHALGLDLTGLMRDGDRRLDGDELARIEAFAARRLGHEPVARIIGVKEFWGLPFKVTPDVLVPRPETETIVEQALAAVDRTGTRSGDLRIADLGVGSGAIMIALLTELPNATGIGTDRDPAVLALARENARCLGVASRAAFAACDFAAAVPSPIHRILAAAKLKSLSLMCACLIRASRSTAVPTALQPIASSRRRRAASSNEART
jgi:release factor glutamine methyltransferase